MRYIIFILLFTASPLFAATNEGPILQTLSLTTGDGVAGGTYPFTVGLVFKEGDTTGPTLDLTDYACTAKRSWNDGSVKHAICSGYATFVADTPYSVNVYSAGTQPTGTDLTEQDLIDTAPIASFYTADFKYHTTSYGAQTITLADQLGSPIRTFISTPMMIETHYQKRVAESNSNTYILFHVRHYRDGENWIRVIGHTGDWQSGPNSFAYYVPDVDIDGTTEWDNSSTEFTHKYYTRWVVDGWDNGTDPGITIAQDTDYMQETGLVPNYWKGPPSEAVLNGTNTQYTTGNGDPLANLDAAYTPGGLASWWTSQGDPGFQTQIALLPWWDAVYITSGADSRAYNSMIANAKGATSYGIWQAYSPSTYEPYDITDYPSNTFANGGGTDGLVNGWERNHHGSIGYLAYLVTGDYLYYESLRAQAYSLFYCETNLSGYGTSKVFGSHVQIQPRGIAWSLRSISQFVAVAPMDDDISTDMRTLLSNNIDDWYTVQTNPLMNDLGLVYARTFLTAEPYYSTQSWMTSFWAQTLGMAVDMQPLADDTNLVASALLMYKSAIAMGGPGGTGNYCYRGVADYSVWVTDTNDVDPTTWTDDWGAVWLESGSYVADCPDGLAVAASESPESYWAQWYATINYAIEDGADGASEALTRVKSASNWSAFEDSGFDDMPIWGIEARGVGTVNTITATGISAMGVSFN